MNKVTIGIESNDIVIDNEITHSTEENRRMEGRSGVVGVGCCSLDVARSIVEGRKRDIKQVKSGIIKLIGFYMVFTEIEGDIVFDRLDFLN